MTHLTHAHILQQAVHDWASREAQDAREKGQNVPLGIFIERLAERVGVSRRMIYKYLSGECTPQPDTLVAICDLIESTLPVEWYCRQVKLGFYRRPRGDGGRPADMLQMTATQLKESAQAGQVALRAIADGQISINELLDIQKQFEEAQDSLTALFSALKGAAERELRR